MRLIYMKFRCSITGLRNLFSERFSARKKIAVIPSFIIAAAAILTSCSKWTDLESIPVESIHPWESEPELWEEYKADLRDYKSHEHTMVYVRFENSPENPVSEKGSLRSLPDSIDIVSLTNADNFSQFDAEDMAWMKSVGTKVLYQLDIAGRMDEFSDATKLDAYIDGVIASVKSNGLDGYSFTGTPKSGDQQREEMSRKIVEKLDKARTSGQLIVFEGSHSFIVKEDIPKIDLFVLPTENVERSWDLNNILTGAKDYGVPEEKILIATKLDGVYYDEDNVELPVVQAMADNVNRYGPMAGLALYGIEDDYFHMDGTWMTVRSAIERLNPSK